MKARKDTRRRERCLLCRRPLERAAALDGGLCAECADAVGAYIASHGLTARHNQLAITHLWEIGAATNRYGGPEQHRPLEWLVRAPTYYGSAKSADGAPVTQDEFDAPEVPVLVHSADGVRLVLGSHDYEDMSWPDLQVERRPKGWAIFLHPLGGGDPSGYVYFLDDGRSFVMPESAFGATPPIELMHHSDDFNEIDMVD
jgi:hypothetical protein